MKNDCRIEFDIRYPTLKFKSELDIKYSRVEKNVVLTLVFDI